MTAADLITPDGVYRLASRADEDARTLTRWTAILDLPGEECGEEIDIDAADRAERDLVLAAASTRDYEPGLIIRTWIERVPGVMYW